MISLEVPGVDEKDIHVELNDRVLTIRGNKRHEESGEDESYHWVERSYGAFQRLLSLPDDALDEGLSARFRKGVLTIEVPRDQGRSNDDRRVIEVQSG